MGMKFLISYRRKGNKCWNDIALADSFREAVSYALEEAPEDWPYEERILASGNYGDES